MTDEEQAKADQDSLMKYAKTDKILPKSNQQGVSKTTSVMDFAMPMTQTASSQGAVYDPNHIYSQAELAGLPPAELAKYQADIQKYAMPTPGAEASPTPTPEAEPGLLDRLMQLVSKKKKQATK